MSAPKIQKVTLPKGAIVVNVFSPSLNVEMVIVFRRPFDAKKQMRKIRNMRKLVSSMGSDLEIVPSIV